MPSARTLGVMATLGTSSDPNLMSPTERIREVGEILAAGILRLRAKATEARPPRDLSLDFPATRSVHAGKRRCRETAWKTAC